jgi:hypothetical protein
MLLIASTPCIAADFWFEETKDAKHDGSILHMQGAIESGDSAKLDRLISDHNGSYFRSFVLLLDSRGGNVEEAIKIAATIEHSGETVFVDADSTCASSCFLIYVSAPMRSALGSLIIHRPYYDMKSLNGDSQTDASKAYQDSTLAMRNYLQSRSMPSDLIDRMIETPSTEGYLLTTEDKLRVGYLSPAVGEMALQKCGLPHTYEIFKPQYNVERDCVRTYLIQAKIDYLVKLRAN